MVCYKSILPFLTLYRCDLVPVFAFGQNNLFPLVGGGYNSRFSRFQRWLYSKTHAGCVCCWGLSCCLPKRSPIFVVGKDSILMYFIAARISEGGSARFFSNNTYSLWKTPQAKCEIELYLIAAMFLPVYSTLGSKGPVEKLKGGHGGEKRVTIFRYRQIKVLLTGLS